MGLRKENGGHTHEMKTASVSSTASISFLHWVSRRAAADDNSVFFPFGRECDLAHACHVSPQR